MLLADDRGSALQGVLALRQRRHVALIGAAGSPQTDGEWGGREAHVMLCGQPAGKLRRGPGAPALGQEGPGGGQVDGGEGEGAPCGAGRAGPQGRGRDSGPSTGAHTWG